MDRKLTQPSAITPSSQDRVARPDSRVARKAIAGCAVVLCAFGVGLWLGTAPPPTEIAAESSTSAVANLFVTPPREPSAEPESHEHPAPTHNVAREARTLRVRSTAKISSGEARAGDPVLFVTEHAVETVSGQHVPAGALVEGVISKATRSTAANPGSLVIEIRAFHVGNQAIPLHALPYIPATTDPAVAAETAAAKKKIDIEALGIRTSLRINSEAVMPRESVIEFQLVESVPDGKNPMMLDLQERIAPLREAMPQDVPTLAPTLPPSVPATSTSPAPVRKRRILEESV